MSHRALPVVLCLAAVGTAAEPFRIHPDNPKYFLFRGKPLVLVTATEQPPASLCKACFDGNYPIELPGETALGKNVIEQMLATAARTGIPLQADNDNVSALRRP